MPLTFKMTLDDERQHLTVEMLEDNVALAHAVLEVSEIATLIDLLAANRAQMADQVPHDVDPGTRLPALVDPRWEVRPNTEHGGQVLALRHPGLGWLAFLLPDAEAASMAKLLDPPYRTQN